MIHIVFNEIEIKLLQEVIALDESLEGEVIQIKDDYAVGPVTAIFETEGYQERRNWWETLLTGSPYTEQTNIVDDKLTVHQLIKKLNEDESETVWIWMGQNQHDVCGYYWLISQLQELQGRIMVLYLNNLPFINEKGQLFYPQWLHEIPVKEFLKAKKLNRPVTPSEFEMDIDEWKKIMEQNSLVRILEGGKKIAGQPVSFFDAEIIKLLSKEWQKATRVLQNTLHKMPVKTGDVFIMWRIKQLITEGAIACNGDTHKSWKDFEIKLPGAATEAVTGELNTAAE